MIEIEAKFSAPTADALERLAKVGDLAGYRLAGGEVAVMTDAYLDTSDRALRAAGLMVRRRKRGDRVVIAVKRPASGSDGSGDEPAGDRAASGEAVHHREEYEFDLPVGMAPEAPADQWPAGTARDLVLAAAGKQPLATLAEGRQRRLVRTVWKNSREVAELSLDTFVIVVRGEELAPQYEVEVELKAAEAEADLATIAGELRRGWGLKPQPLSKYERALAAMGDDQREEEAPDAAPPAAKDAPSESVTPKRPGILAADSMVDAAFKTLRFHFARMLAHERGTRAGDDPEDLHDMRVATRRMRAALRVFAPYLDQDVMKPVERGLRRTGRKLGSVRDLDVFHEKTQAYLGELPVAPRGELDPLLEVWRRRYEKARADLLSYLDGPRYAHFVADMTALLDRPRAGGPSCRRRQRRGPPAPGRACPAGDPLRQGCGRVGLRRRDSRTGHAPGALPSATHRRQGDALHVRVLRGGPGA